MTTAHGPKAEGESCSFHRDVFCSRNLGIPLEQGFPTSLAPAFFIVGIEHHSFLSQLK